MLAMVPCERIQKREENSVGSISKINGQIYIPFIYGVYNTHCTVVQK